MYRTIKDELIQWKNNKDKKPLIISGARQVGKTYIIEEFAKENYKYLIEINFSFDVYAKEYFGVSRSYEEIINYIEINNLNIDFENNDDILVFFDEIQLVPELISELKMLKINCPYDIICSGTMLGVSLNRTSSYPVGYVENKIMYPMSFKEFIIAYGIDEKFIEIIKNSILNKTIIPEAIHNKMNELFNNYLVVGGLPEAVKTYIDKKSISEAIKVLRRLNNDYMSDIAAYAERDIRLKAIECYESLPIQLAKENKKFQYSVVKKGYNARYYDSSLKWLENGGLIIKNTKLQSVNDPLKAFVDLSCFKIYSFDTGLLVSRFDDSTIQKILDNALNIYNGVVYENVFSQTLQCCDYEQYYYESRGSNEIDFITYFQNEIVPIEVKSGLHTRSTSFNNFIKNNNSRLSFRLSKKNVGYDSKYNTYYLPQYAMALLLQDRWPIVN